MTVEREVELAKGIGEVMIWKSFGLEDIQLTIAPTVYPPREDSILLDSVLAELGSGGNRRLLEIGCGSGAISISCAMRGWSVLSCDTNPLAVATARGNASEHGCELSIAEGGPGDSKVWQPDQGVDVIAWNLPYLDSTSGETLGPLEDSALIEQKGDVALLEELNLNPMILKPGGVVYLVHSSNRLGARVPRNWRRAGWATRNVKKISLGDEILTVIACWRPFENAEISRLEICESTNEEILARDQLNQGDLIICANQTLGRGYRNNKWASSEHNFMGSWALDVNSIDRGPEFLQYAATIAVLDTISCFKKFGLPSHSWVHCSSLESVGIRVKWPNDIWLRTSDMIGKMCGVLVQGQTKGEDTCVALGIGLNQVHVPEVKHSIGWADLLDADLEEIIPVIHASVASTLECHPLIRELPSKDILNTVFAGMRMTFCEGNPQSFGLDTEGGLFGVDRIQRSNDGWSWNWS